LNEPRILFYDIETAPLLSYTWGMYEQNVIDVKRSWYMLSFAYKWQGQKRVHTKALPDYKNFKKNMEDDSFLVKELWTLFDEADIIIAHNGDRFDAKKANARFLFHGKKPPSPYKSIDTLKIARNKFAFSSNRLNDLGAYLGVGRKLPTTGFHLWKGCMKGEASAWRKMRAYNARDVELLERVYLKLRAWGSHPNLTAYSGNPGCPTCQSTNVQRRGWNIARVRKTPRFQCRSCGTWFAG
jgi:hypothetical protein